MKQSSLAASSKGSSVSAREQKTVVHSGITDVSTSETQQVCFMLAGGEYGVDISLVKEIIKPTMEPTPVPQSPPFVKGVIDLRGDIIPIIDLKKRFGLDPDEGALPTRILVIKINEIIVGFLVDSVTEVLRTQKQHIQNAPGKVVGVDTEYIWGVTKRNPDSHLIMLLDIERILKIDYDEPLEGETTDTA